MAPAAPGVDFSTPTQSCSPARRPAGGRRSCPFAWPPPPPPLGAERYEPTAHDNPARLFRTPRIGPHDGPLRLTFGPCILDRTSVVSSSSVGSLIICHSYKTPLSKCQICHRREKVSS